MPKLLAALLALLLASPGAVHADDWRTVVFDGREFRGGTPGVLALRDGFLPFRPYSGLSLSETRLPAGSGALAGFCFIQTSGGKLGTAAGFLPLPGEPVEISGRKFSVMVRTDGGGYFTLALPPAAYELRWRGFTKRLMVTGGSTTLVALRGGKRLVD